MTISFQPPAIAGLPTSRPGCPEPHPAWPGMPAGMGHPQPPWATCSVRHHPLGEKLPPHIQRKPPLSQLKTIPPCPVTIIPCKQPFPLLFICSLQVLEGHNEVSLQPFWSKTHSFPEGLLGCGWTSQLHSTNAHQPCC